MHVKKSGFVISLKEETMLKARQEDHLLDILQSSYPFYQLLDETDSCEDCRKKSGRIYPVSEAEIGLISLLFILIADVLLWEYYTIIKWIHGSRKTPYGIFYFILVFQRNIRFNC